MDGPNVSARASQKAGSWTARMYTLGLARRRVVDGPNVYIRGNFVMLRVTGYHKPEALRSTPEVTTRPRLSAGIS
jgi:hypothetical protein